MFKEIFNILLTYTQSAEHMKMKRTITSTKATMTTKASLTTKAANPKKDPLQSKVSQDKIIIIFEKDQKKNMVKDWHKMDYRQKLEKYAEIILLLRFGQKENVDHSKTWLSIQTIAINLKLPYGFVYKVIDEHLKSNSSNWRVRKNQQWAEMKRHERLMKRQLTQKALEEASTTEFLEKYTTKTLKERAAFINLGNDLTNIDGPALHRHYKRRKIKFKIIRVTKNRVEKQKEHDKQFIGAKRLIDRSKAAGKRIVYVDEMTVTAGKWQNKAFHQANRHHFVQALNNKKQKTVYIIAGVSE